MPQLETRSKSRRVIARVNSVYGPALAKSGCIPTPPVAAPPATATAPGAFIAFAACTDGTQQGGH